jgi:ABC-type Fe3+/spermidine/putrescine transport system ATPase subunit
MVRVLGVTKFYGDTMACNKIEIQVNKGEFFTLLGPSGCGKTTLLRLIAGFVEPDEGNIILGGKEITNMPAEKRKIGMVFQNYALFPHMNVYENIAYGLAAAKKRRKDIEIRVMEYLEIVNLSGYATRQVSELSGGEQQRVALARALIMEPQVLLLDEPLSNLDAKLKHKMRQELKAIQKQLGITTIFVTHDQQEALMISDRIAVFNQGKCLQVGTPNEVYQKPINRFVASFIGETNWFEKENFPFDDGNGRLERHIAIRPQDIKMSRDPFGEGIVEGKNVAGIVVEYRVRYRGHQLKTVALNNVDRSGEYELGERVRISANAENARSFGR